jgi:TolB-like protein/DNA-binding winged helix-turn-helix (wHTH) protein/Tfp pilus assembly protein PilF
MSESAHAPRVVRFGIFDVDMQAGQLCKAGLRVKLQEQPFQFLTVLLERPGELVTREELRQRLWPADTFVDVDLSLNGALKKLRYALGDVADNPTFIETIPRRGYRFIASVRPVTVDFANREERMQLVPSPMPAPALLLSWPRVVKLSLLALAVAGAMFVVWRVRGRARSSANPPSQVKIQSLAVLPLENLSGDPSQDYFADGMTDALITSLGQISSLRVISRTSVIQYRGVHKHLPQIAHELNVDVVVEGTVVQSSRQVRITAQLIQASTDKHLWSQSYQRDLKDVLGLQHEIASAIANQIRVTLTPDEQIGAGIKQSVNVDAYEAYLRGLYSLNRFTPDSLRAAADYFRQAIEKDPSYPPAYIRLASCYQLLADTGALPPKVAYPKAKPLIAKALELDSQLAIAHALRGWDLLNYELDFAAGGAEFHRAIELNSNSAEGHLGMSDYYAAMGRMQESVQELQRARELAPLDWIVNVDLCAKLYFARRYDEALAQCKANMDLDRSSPIPFAQLGSIYAAKGMDAEAALAFLRSHELGGASPAMIAALKAGERDSGLTGFWRAWLQFQRSNIAAGNQDTMAVARIHSRAGNTDKALIWLEKSFTARRTWIIYLGVDPTFDSLRADPRFASLLKRIGLPPNPSKTLMKTGARL